MPKCGIADGYVREQSPRSSSHHALGSIAIPIYGKQGEWCDLTATTPNTRIAFLNVIRGDRPLVFLQLNVTAGLARPGPMAPAEERMSRPEAGSCKHYLLGGMRLPRYF